MIEWKETSFGIHYLYKDEHMVASLMGSPWYGYNSDCEEWWLETNDYLAAELECIYTNLDEAKTDTEKLFM